MITGFNTDIKHNEKVYHIQTEDKGLQNPYIESLVYVGGEILASKKTSYADKIKEGVDEKFIGTLMEHQHRTMIAAIKRGKLDAVALDNTQTGTEIAKSAKTMSQPLPPEVAVPAEERTLDQVIIDYLASEAESEHLELSLLNPVEFVSGQSIDLRVSTKRSISQQPIMGSVVEMRLISTVEPPRVIFKGKSGPDGVVSIRCTIPNFHEGTAAVIISAQSTYGNDEVKQLVKRKK
ncbi:MAG TPA: hypothetical protein VHL58_18080 [Thermoanaerobaculia bacterium]|nr:hypothetical protein [Thermoanaerobaculia bacterium]